MATHGPTIPTALMVTTQGRVEVHPAAEDWYQQVETLRYASQRGQLFCPDCGERLKYYSEVRTPHFRHLKDTVGCTDEVRYPDRANRRREKWFRNSLVASFRQVFPPGTSFLADDYLGNHDSHLVVRLPSGSSFILHVITEKPDMQVWERRRTEFEATGLPIVHVFGRGRVKGAVRNAPIGRTGILVDDGLNADHIDSLRPLLVDIAHVAKESFFDLPVLKADPATLYFFEPAESPNNPGLLTIIRGLMPSTEDTVYHGVALKVETTGHGQGRLRFSLRHGFYATDDLDVLIWLRNGWRRRRQKGPHNLLRPSAARKHPLRLRWEQKQADLAAEQDRLRREHVRLQAEAEAQRAQQQKFRAEQLAALRAANKREAELEQQGREVFDNLMRLLPLEGAEVLRGRAFPVSDPAVFTVPLSEWQAALLGYAYRARIPFTEHEAALWLLWRGYAAGRTVQAVQEITKPFWKGTQAAGLLTIGTDRRDDLITPITVPGAYRWPVAVKAQVDNTPALCVICAAAGRNPSYRMTDDWRYHDPANRLCLCAQHSRT